jgi:uncharacterized membrane protein YccC
VRPASSVDLRSLVTWAPGPPRRWFALRAAVALGLPLVVAAALGHGSSGFLTSLGAFSVLYGAGAAVRRRARVITGVGAGLWLSATVGVLTAGHAWAALIAMVAVATLSAWACYALRIGPPGAFFFALVTGVANLAAGGGTGGTLVLGLSLVGVVVAVVVGTSDGWFRSHGVEEAAVAQAERQVARFERQSSAAELGQARADASAALHAAWTAVTDGGSEPRYAARLEQVHLRYVRRTVRLAGHLTGLDVRPWEELERVEEQPVDASADYGRTGAEQEEIEQTQVRQTALGRPDTAYLLRQAAWWPSESLLVAARVLVATAVAGTVATSAGNEHTYWAVAFATLIVAGGGSRRVQATKAVHRIIGTAAGLAVFALVLEVGLSGWGTVLFVVLLQGVVELVVTRHYALAVTALTPLALTISAEVTGMSTETIVLDRVLDTALGVGTALVVLVLSGVGGHELVLRAHARRVALGVDQVLADLLTGVHDSDDGRRRRQHLYAELLESDLVARRALSDAPRQVEPYRQMERTLSHVGYLVLGAAWHSRVAGERDRFAAAREALARVLGRPVTERRPAGELTTELGAVEQALLGG